MESEPQPPCLVCGRPIATEEQWETLPEGEGIDLCWTGAECGSDIPAMLKRIEELTKERDEALTRVSELTRACCRIGGDLSVAEARIAELEALLPQAFDAGSAWCMGNHEDFQQIHPDRDTWVRDALGKEMRDGE